MKRKLILILIFSIITTTLLAKVPYLINYQGKLMENGVPVNGSHNIVFRIYDAPTDGTLIWEGDVQTVQITNGLFSAYIGETTAVGSPIAFSNIDWGSGDKYLEIQIDTDTMQPRERLTSVAYALFAKDIEDNSVTSSKIVDNTISANDLASDANSLSKVSGGNMTISGGNVGIGCSPTAKLEVQGGVIKATGGIIIELRTSDPASPQTGRIWLRTDL